MKASKSVETGEHKHLNQPSKPVFVLNEPVTNKDLLFPKTPIINITSAKDALSDNVSLNAENNFYHPIFSYSNYATILPDQL